jgi:hypothetical protein
MAKARAYDYWSSLDKIYFNADGTMKEDCKNRLLAQGTSIFDIFLMEAEKQKDIKDFEEREQFCLERYGETFSSMTARRSQKLTPAQQEKRQQQALDSGEELSSLPYHMEPDDYYDYYALYPC